MASSSQHLDQFRAFIKELCGTAPASIDADGKWHRFRIEDTRSKASTPGAYLMHLDENPVGLFMDWRRGERHRWRPGGATGAIDRESLRKQAAETEERRRAGYAEAAAKALTFFQKECVAINGASHPYLERKRIGPHGARQGSGRPFGLGDQPCLIVPIRGPDNKALTLQAICGDGERRFWPGSTTEGGYTLIGRDDGKTVIVLCEGFATGATIHEATGWLVVVCLSASNLVRVSRWAGHRWPGRPFVVAGDDDWHLPRKEKPQPNEGLEAAIKAARNLGCRHVLPDMQGVVTDGGDDFNDQAVEYGLEDVAATLVRALHEPDQAPEPDADADADRPLERRRVIPVIHPADWHGVQIPDRRWRLEGFIPDGQATLFTGAGAVGKSLATQQMSTCIAMGLPFLGVRVDRSPALYVTCEDDADELQRRQASICRALGITLEQTRGHLMLISLAGEIGNEFARFDTDGKMIPAERYADILEAATAHAARHVTLDNTAHFFSGNENDRHQVAGFVSLSNRLAREIGGSVIVVGHPNKAGDSYSGSTAWENQVRSRLYMETPKSEDGVVVDADLRVLRNEKANYAQRNQEIRFVWHSGAFVHEDVILADRAKKDGDTLQQGRDNELFLRLLDQLIREKRRTSTSTRSGSFAPKIMHRMTEARGVSVQRLHDAMERLLLREIIENDAPLWVGKDRHVVLGLARKKEKSDAK